MPLLVTHVDLYPFVIPTVQVKAEKCGSTMWTEVHELAAHLRDGETKWEDLNLDDVDIRMKFAGLFHRGKRTPKRFMMRLKVTGLAGVDGWMDGWMCGRHGGVGVWVSRYMPVHSDRWLAGMNTAAAMQGHGQTLSLG